MIWKTFKRSCNRSCPWVVLAEAHIMWTQNSDSCHIYLRTIVAITRWVRSEALFLPGLPPSKATTSSMLTFHSQQIPSEHTLLFFSPLMAHASSHYYCHPLTGSIFLSFSISHSSFISFDSLSNPFLLQPETFSVMIQLSESKLEFQFCHPLFLGKLTQPYWNSSFSWTVG